MSSIDDILSAQQRELMERVRIALCAGHTEVPLPATREPLTSYDVVDEELLLVGDLP
jgi:hypothetical protein